MHISTLNEALHDYVFLAAVSIAPACKLQLSSYLYSINSFVVKVVVQLFPVLRSLIYKMRLQTAV